MIVALPGERSGSNSMRLPLPPLNDSVFPSYRGGPYLHGREGILYFG
jgi:hypothetical protein